MAVIGSVAGAVIFILLLEDGEDRPSGIFMSVLMAFAASVVAAAAAMATPNLQSVLSQAEGSRI